MQLTSHPAFPAARYYSLGEPGADIQHVWFCLAGHDQSVADLAAQLVNLDTPERLLILPQTPNRARSLAGGAAAAPGSGSGHYYRLHTPKAEGVGLVQDLRAAGRPAQLRYVDEGPLTLAALGAGGEPSGLRPH